jgi:hypothetical protein
MNKESVGKQHRMLCNQKFTGQRLLWGGKLFLGNKILGNKLNKGKKKLNPLKDT